MIRNKNQRGFVLIELLTVVSIIGFLATAGLVVTTKVRTSAKSAKMAQDLRSITLAFGLYVSSTGYLPPRDNAFSYDDTCEQNSLGQYIKWPKTPWNTHYNYRSNSILFAHAIDIDGIPAADALVFDKLADDGSFASGQVRYGVVEPGEPVIMEIGMYDVSYSDIGFCP